ncbi:uncharacterized protein LOC119110326 [Pollicipes pollicipes]|uniref:uncharacterized protein LOC119110326 n=1 Tax=Pollicipes pollicipes TaxID=41117 RepID=UPI00188544D4|nr:uncharacterized protein LOC119110326 [Pollicipes pollicipes]
MSKLVLKFAMILLVRRIIADDRASILLGVDSDTTGQKSTDEKRQSDEISVISEDSPHRLVVVGGDDASDDHRLITVDSDGAGPAGGVLLGRSRLVSVERAAPEPVVSLLEPLMLPPVLDVYPEVPDRVGDTPLQVETVVEAAPPNDEQQLDVPWVWDDKVCSALLNRPAPATGPLTSAEVTFSLPLVIREGKKLKLKTRTGAVSALHSEEAAATFEKLFWCITALIARVREPDERSKLMKKLYQDYLLWMEEDVIPVFNRTDLKRAYKWIKKKDESQWVVPEKKIYDSATKHSQRGTRDDHASDSAGDKTALIIAILIFIVIILILLYCCLVKKKKLFNFSCFCVCERCKKRQGGRYCEEERKPLKVQKVNMPAGADGPKKTYVYRSSSWSSNSSLQTPCNPLQDPCNKQRQQAPCP